MKETQLYAILRPQLSKWGQFDRVENLISSGMSDVFYNIGGQVGWLETKLAKGTQLYFEKFQPQWIGKHVREGARVFVVVLLPDLSINLYDGASIVLLPRTNYKKWVVVDLNNAIPMLEMPKPYKKWDIMRDMLSS